MIVVYPLLCSNSVNYSALPGICKALERYVILYRLDDILKESRKEVKKSRKSRLQIKEGCEIDFSNFHLVSEQTDHDDYEERPTGGLKPRGKGSTMRPGEELGPGEEDVGEFTFSSEIDPREKEKLDKEKERLEREKDRLEREKDKMERERERVKDTETYTKRKEEFNSKINQMEKDKLEINKKLDQIEKRKQEIEDRKKQIRDATTRMSMPSEGLSVEPTWIYVDRIVSGEKVTDILGIKVVPFMVQSDESLANLMLYDQNLKKWDTKIVSFGRKIRKFVYDQYKNFVSKIPLAGRFIGGRGTIKGDPRSDVLIAKSSFRKNILVCLNRMDLDDNFFEGAGGVNKLFKLGWSSFVVMDDVNKNASFCMEEFKGICYNVNYGYIFSTFGKAQKEVFDDLNDVKKSSGGLFRKKTKKSKALSEYYTGYLVNRNLSGESAFLSEVEKQCLLSESSFDIKKQVMSATRSIKDVLGSLKSGQPNKIEAVLNRYTKDIDSVSRAKSKAAKLHPNFKAGYDRAKKNIKKDIWKLDRRLGEIVACLIGLYAVRDLMAGGKGSLKHTDGMINKFNKKVDKQLKKKLKTDDENMKDNPDYKLGIAVLIGIITLAVPITTMFIYITVFKTDLLQSFGAAIYTLISSVVIIVLSLIKLAYITVVEVLAPLASVGSEILPSVAKEIGAGISGFASFLSTVFSWLGSIGKSSEPANSADMPGITGVTPVAPGMTAERVFDIIDGAFELFGFGG